MSHLNINTLLGIWIVALIAAVGSLGYAYHVLCDIGDHNVFNYSHGMDRALQPAELSPQDHKDFVQPASGDLQNVEK